MKIQKRTLQLFIFIFAILSLTVIASITEMTAYATDEDVLTFIYDDTTLTAEISKCEPSVTSVTIPYRIVKDGKTYTVTAIRDNAFDGCRALKDVYYQGSYRNRIEDLSINYYENSYLGATYATWHYSVEECIAYTYDDINLTATVRSGEPSITTITIPSTIVKNNKTYTVTGIGKEAFWSRENLTSVTIPEGVIDIGVSAFNGCSKLTSITIPDSVTSIGYCAFLGCSSLENVVIPDGVTTIGEAAFMGCFNLKTLTIGKNVYKIGFKAFNSNSLETVYFNAVDCHLEEGSLSVFEDCDNLKTVYFGDDVRYVNFNIFEDCTSITTVVMGKSVRYIDKWAFAGCSSLESIIIPDSVSYIGPYAFYNCTNLKSVILSKNITSINSCTFSGCVNLTSIEIHEGVTSIGGNAFESCMRLKSITIPRSMETIGKAFFGCDSLTDVWYNGYEEEKKKISISTEETYALTSAVWHCKQCDGNHVYADACDENCEYCGYIRETEHSNKIWKVSTSNHWKECSICGEKDYTTSLPHNFDNSCDATCETCGYTRTVPHSYKTTWENDKDGHWHECSICGESDGLKSHTPSAAATETTAQTCTTCGYVIKAALGHTHSYEKEWTTNSGKHWHSCSGCGDRKDEGNHVYDNSCDTACNTCGFVRAISHSYDNEYDAECNVCGHTRQVETTPEQTTTPVETTIPDTTTTLDTTTDGGQTTEPTVITPDTTNGSNNNNSNGLDSTTFIIVIVAVAVGMLGLGGGIIIVNLKKK